MAEDKKHQLDEVPMTDIVSYLGARLFDMEEYIRREGRQLTKAKEIIKDLLFFLNKSYNEDCPVCIDEAEQFLKEVVDK